MDRMNAVLQELREKSQREAEQQPPRSAPVKFTSRKKRIVVIVAAVLLGAMMVGPKLLSGTQPQQHMISKPTPHTTLSIPAAKLQDGRDPLPLQWKPVIESLDVKRGQAFIARDFMTLLEVDVTESPAYKADSAMIELLRQGQAFVDEVPLRVVSVEEQFVTVGEKEQRAMLTVTDDMGAYNIVDKSGTVLRRVPARGVERWSVELQNDSVFGWRYVSVTTAPKQ